MVCTGREPPCGRCAGCEKAAAGRHPDVITFAPAEGKREITVEQIRRLRSDAWVAPNEGRRKVYLLDPASAMNENAQNALLKVLEEGPEQAAFLLIARTAAGLLHTVRSRCEHLDLTPPPTVTPPSPEGTALAKAILSDGELALLERCVELEKLERKELLVLLEETMAALSQRLREDPSCTAKAAAGIETLKLLRAAGECGVNGDQLAGWLCARTYRSTPWRKV